MTFDDHYERISTASALLSEAIQAAAKDGIKVDMERLQFTGFFLPEIKLSRQIPVSSDKPPFPRLR